MRMLDLFAGRLGWSKAFLERGWEVVAYDLVLPDMEIPAGVDYRIADILTLTPADVQGFDFVCASSPCEKFSVHGMKHFHPNPPYPTLGIELFNHTRMLCEASGKPYIMENVRAAQAFVGNATHHWGPFYLWGPGVPILAMQGITKGMNLGSNTVKKSMTAEEKRLMRKLVPMCSTSSGSKARKLLTADVATIPPELAHCVAEYAERLTFSPPL